MVLSGSCVRTVPSASVRNVPPAIILVCSRGMRPVGKRRAAPGEREAAMVTMDGEGVKVKGTYLPFTYDEGCAG